MSKILAVANPKGGVGKTTTTVNLAAALKERGRSVLVVDFDPQASLTLSFGLRLSSRTRTIYDCLTPDATPLAAVVQSTPEGMDLAPASQQLAAFSDQPGVNGRPGALRSILEPIRDRYDYIVIDCPANTGILTGNALVAANEVLIPLAADHLALSALEWLMVVIKRVKETVNPNLRIAGIVFTMYDSRTRHARQIMNAARQAYGAEVPYFATAVRYCVSLKDASMYGQSVLRYATESTAADAYRNLASEIEEGLRATPENELYLALDRGELALKEKDLKTAYACFCRATELGPNQSRAWLGRADSALEWTEQVTSCGRAAHLAPQDENIRARLAQLVMEGASAAKADSLHSLIAAGQYLGTIGEAGLAEMIFARATTLDPSNAAAWLGRARTASDPRNGVTYVEKVLEADSGNDLAQAELEAAHRRVRVEAERLVEKGLAETHAGRTEAAHAAYTSATEMDPLYDRAWLQLARAENDFQLMFSYAKRALEINPENKEARELTRLLYQPEESRGFKNLPWLRLLVPLGTVIILLIALLVWSGYIRLF